MVKTLELLLQHQNNGVISMEVLKKDSPYLYRLLVSNFDTLSPSLLAEGVEILSKKSDVRLYLKYHFGNTINLSLLRSEYQTTYRKLSKEGKPREVLERMGFRVEYNTLTPEDALLEEVKTYKEAGKPLPKKLHNQLYYRSRQHGLTVSDYIKRR